MRRAALERPRTLRVWRAHNRLIHEGDATDCVCAEQPGLFRKGARIAGCSKPGCWICKRPRFKTEPTPQATRASVSQHEWCIEFGLSILKS